MKTVAEALSLVLQHAGPLSAGNMPTCDVLGLILAEDVVSDIHSPPHDKSVVDGFAIRTEDFLNGRASLQVLEIVTAGEVPQFEVTTGKTSQIMTGAPVPRGANAVVMVERSNLQRGASAAPNDLVEITDPKLTAGQNIMLRGTSMRQGDVVLSAGTSLRSIELGILAEVGRSQVQVHRRPCVGVLATGNKLVGTNAVPHPGQIRNSNGPLLMALTQESNCLPMDLGIASDDANSLRQHIAKGLSQCDVLLLSGGVSAGVLDLVPAIFAELGVAEVFHQVQLKPGKPLWFGLYEQAGKRCLVFGLPGNPVSSYVCFKIFVRAALDKMLGKTSTKTVLAALAQSHQTRGDRATYWPSRLVQSNNTWQVEPLRWNGSGDLRSLTNANSLAIFPMACDYQQGESVEVIPL